MRVPSRRVSVTAKFTTSDLCDAGSDAPAASAHRTSVDDVIAAIDINRVAGDETRRVVREEGGGGADVVDTDEAAGRRLGFRFVEQGAKFRDAARVASGRGEIALTRMPFGPSAAATYRTAASSAAFATPMML